jgi:mitochondrial fission protein ELM1
MIKDEIWVLADDRPGNVSQIIGLAREISSETGFKTKIIELEYNSFSNLPNLFLGHSLLHLSAKSKDHFKNLSYFPKLAISAGRRSAPVILHLKNQSQSQTRIIQIMNPDSDLKKFDAVILPKHDQINNKDGFSNLITTIGSLTKINDEIIIAERKKFAAIFDDIKKSKIVLLVGGSSNKTKFGKNSALNLVKNAALIANNMNAILLVLNSRRSGKEISDVVKSNLTCDFKFFDWQEVKNANPYLAILGSGDFFIISGDSVSMISECCSTGKPVYIFDEAAISSHKHRQFHQNLFEENYAKKLTPDLCYLENFLPKKLQETKRVANLLITNFNLNKL